MTAKQIQALRHALKENAETFGARFLVSGRTVEGWEQGREPHRLVSRMLDTLAVEVKHAARRSA
jgi:DNA-binding transcriptional regulator YiaG